MVSGLFRRSSRGIASEICRLWVTAAGVAVVVTAVRVGSTLINSLFIDTRSSSSSSLEMINREVPPRKSNSSV